MVAAVLYAFMAINCAMLFEGSFISGSCGFRLARYLRETSIYQTFLALDMAIAKIQQATKNPHWAGSLSHMVAGQVAPLATVPKALSRVAYRCSGNLFDSTPLRSSLLNTHGVLPFFYALHALVERGLQVFFVHREFKPDGMLTVLGEFIFEFFAVEHAKNQFLFILANALNHCGSLWFIGFGLSRMSAG
jgi:hypothetical protein